MLINLVCIALYTAWPAYTPLFMHTALHNPAVRFTLVTNLNESHQSWSEHLGTMPKPNNVVLVPYSFDELVTTIHKDNLGLGPTPLSITSIYKLIDYKPMFGVLFHRELVGFSHWGWFDLDIIVGNITSVYGCNYTGREDFISYDNTLVHGPMMINRNTELVTTFYKNVLSFPKHRSGLGKSRAMLFDEIVLPILISRNSSVVSMSSHKRNCDTGGVWMWYRGEMQNRLGPCVIHHFGGGGRRQSRESKDDVWARNRAFFDGDFHKTGLHGFGTAKRLGGYLSFVFTFTKTNDFVIVNSTSTLNPGLNSTALFRMLTHVAKRFMSPFECDTSR